MVLARLVLHFDKRFLVAVLGTAMAMLLPVAGTLVVQGLEPRIDPELGWIAVPEVAGAGFSPEALPETVRAAAAFQDEQGVLLAAYLVGEANVGADQALPMPGAESEGPVLGDVGLEVLPVSPTLLPLLPAGSVLVHPDRLERMEADVLLLDSPAGPPGAIVTPARGADAFEVGGIEELQGSTGLLVAASLPAVVLVAVAFMDQEARQHARTAATFAALGRPRLGRTILALRAIVMAAAATLLATLLGYLLWKEGGATFHPYDTKKLQLVLALFVPGATAAVAGIVQSARRVRSGTQLLRTPDTGEEPPGRRFGFLPPESRPLVLGTRLLPVLFLAGMLFVVDVGFPLAAAMVPAALAGEDEWVVGAQAGVILGGSTSAAPAEVLGFDPAVGAAVAEVLVPTSVEGRPALFRGAPWWQLQAYYGLTGDGPGPDEVLLGRKLAARLGTSEGDLVRVQAADRALVETLVVAGVFRASGLLADEGLLAPETARALIGMGPGQATVVRVRPDTQEALTSLERSDPLLEVLGLRLVPETPREGEPFRMEVDVVNLGASAGSRHLVFRVDGAAVSELTATVSGHARKTFAAYAIAPSGSFDVQVNPTAEGRSGGNTLRLEVPPLTFDDTAVAATLSADGAPVHGQGIGVFAGLQEAVARTAPLATAVTDDAGQAMFPGIVPGIYYANTLDGATAAAEFRVADAVNRTQAAPVVEHVWSTPGNPAVGELVTVHAELWNLGGVAADDSITFSVDGGRFALRYFTLGSGETTTLEAGFILHDPGSVVQVGGKELPLNSRPVTPETVPGGGPEPVQDSTPPQDTRPAEGLQAEVADRLLGDARRALTSLAAIALSTSLAVVYLATDRTVRGRTHVLRVLRAFGEDRDAIRRRATWEGAILGAAAMAVALLVAKALFRSLHYLGRPSVFTHSIPDAFDVLFSVQTLTAFGAVTALAAYLAVGPVLESVSAADKG